jgi:hypothetical protein
LKFCGPVFYHGVYWKWNSGRCVAKAPRGQSFNSGVGHKTTPRFACGNTCTTDLTYEQAIKILNDYFKKINLTVSLFASKETLLKDLNHPISKELGNITHYETGSANFNSLPGLIQKAVLVFNNIGYTADVKGLGKKLVHSIGTISEDAIGELLINGFGTQLNVSSNFVIWAFGDGGVNCTDCGKKWGKNPGEQNEWFKNQLTLPKNQRDACFYIYCQCPTFNCSVPLAVFS